MPTQEINYDDPTLGVYLKFTHLPATQLSTILYHLSELTDNVALLFPAQRVDVIENIIGYVPHLTVDSVHTGQSIDLRFRFDGNWPKIHIERRARGDKSDTVQVVLPKWSLALIVVGYLLDFGLSRYQQVLEIQKLKAEVEQLHGSLRNLDPAKLQDRNDPLVNAIDIHVNSLRQQFNADNIKLVRVNGSLVIDKSAPINPPRE